MQWKLILTVVIISALIAVVIWSIVEAATQDFNQDQDCDIISNINTSKCSAFWGDHGPPLLLISLDGFRSEYLTRYREHDHRDFTSPKEWAAPTIRCLAKKGVRAPYMMPSYPTITFPNHYAIATGLYPESHGIIANEFHDPDVNANFSVRYPNNENPIWWQGEPIWYTIKRQGKKSGAFFWPGSSVQDDRLPNYWLHYNRSITFKSRVDQVLKWIDLPHNERPKLIALYFEEPDSTGHKEGPNTSQVTEKVTVVDNQIRRLVEGMKERNLFGCINMIIVSDHGMAPSPENQSLVDLATYLPHLEAETQVYYGPLTTIRPENDTLEEQERIQKALKCQDPHMRIFNKLELPYRLHFARSRRIPSLILDLDVSWRAVFHNEEWLSKGNHGWDNLYEEMQAVFVAFGPSFKTNMTTRPFENIQLYNLMCALTNVTPAENNGTWGALHHLLHETAVQMDLSLDNSTTKTDMAFLPFPSDVDTYNAHLQRKKCPILKGINNLKMDQILNLTKDRDQLLSKHTPLGIAISLKDSNSRLLVHMDRVTAYDVVTGSALWTEYTSIKSADIIQKQSWRLDVRLQPEHNGICSRSENVNQNDYSFIPLFPAEFAMNSSDVWIDTNIIKVPAVTTSLTNTMNQLLLAARKKHEMIHVISGPIKDPKPALFYIALACNASENRRDLTSCPVEQIDVQAFILPVDFMKITGNCTAITDFIAFNVATFKDIERVTGFNFFSNMSPKDKVYLQSRTTLDTKLIVDPVRYKNT